MNITAPTDKNVSKEYEMNFSEKDFLFLKKFALEKVGIVLNDNKKDMVYSRISRRLRALGISTFANYCKILSQGNSEEISHFLNAITTNFTSFFRENHHFSFLKEKAVPEIIQRHQQDKTVRIWSAGCSSGEEPYSIAVTLRNTHLSQFWDVKILATDIDTNVLSIGKQGLYDKIDEVALAGVGRSWYSNVMGHKKEKILINEDVRKMIFFKHLNLLGDWPIKKKYDVIFCRNVVIYFNKETQRNLFSRFYDQLVEGGYLFIGHSETMTNNFDKFNHVSGTIYRK